MKTRTKRTAIRSALWPPKSFGGQDHSEPPPLARQGGLCRRRIFPIEQALNIAHTASAFRRAAKTAEHVARAFRRSAAGFHAGADIMVRYDIAGADNHRETKLPHHPLCVEAINRPIRRQGSDSFSLRLFLNCDVAKSRFYLEPVSSEHDKRLGESLFDAPGQRDADRQPGEGGFQVEGAAANAVSPDRAGG